MPLLELIGLSTIVSALVADALGGEESDQVGASDPEPSAVLVEFESVSELKGSMGADWKSIHDAYESEGDVRIFDEVRRKAHSFYDRLQDVIEDSGRFGLADYIVGIVDSEPGSYELEEAAESILGIEGRLRGCMNIASLPSVVRDPSLIEGMDVVDGDQVVDFLGPDDLRQMKRFAVEKRSLALRGLERDTDLAMYFLAGILNGDLYLVPAKSMEDPFSRTWKIVSSDHQELTLTVNMIPSEMGFLRPAFTIECSSTGMKWSFTPVEEGHVETYDSFPLGMVWIHLGLDPSSFLEEFVPVVLRG